MICLTVSTWLRCLQSTWALLIVLVMGRIQLVLHLEIINDNPVGDGDTISGLENGELDSNVQWTLQYEDSLVQPVRAVLDVNMGEYASGTR